ncbi:MAG: hypothetical protein AB7T59_01575 [Hyphomonadaceae bacterium]
MIARFTLLVFALIGLIASSFIFEGAFATSLALDTAAKARASDSSVVRQRLLARAEHVITESWAEPEHWHAGAAEALSGIYLMQTQENNEPALFERSAALASHAVRLAPVQPHAWTRLALLAELGHTNSVCAIDACLGNAWTTARMIDPDTACTRLRLTYGRGQLTGDDARIDDYLRSGVYRRTAAECLVFLPGDQLFAALARNAN